MKKSVKNIKTLVDQVIATTNQGYINSKIPLRVTLHCLEETTKPEAQMADLDIFRSAVVDVLQRAAGRKAAESSVRHSGQQGALPDSTCDQICKTIGSFLTSVFRVLLMS